MATESSNHAHPVSYHVLSFRVPSLGRFSLSASILALFDFPLIFFAYLSVQNNELHMFWEPVEIGILLKNVIPVIETGNFRFGLLLLFCLDIRRFR
jgi:hypothetical protein